MSLLNIFTNIECFFTISFDKREILCEIFSKLKLEIEARSIHFFPFLKMTDLQIENGKHRQVIECSVAGGLDQLC